MGSPDQWVGSDLLLTSLRCQKLTSPPELSYRYTACLGKRTLDLNWELRYVYTRYIIATHSSFTLCLSPHKKTMKLWAGHDIFQGLGITDAGLASSVGARRAQEDCRSPLAFHILLTRANLEDWKTWLARERQHLLVLVRPSQAEILVVLPHLYLQTFASTRRKRLRKRKDLQTYTSNVRTLVIVMMTQTTRLIELPDPQHLPLWFPGPGLEGGSSEPFTFSCSA
jgi:hypothetical protein